MRKMKQHIGIFLVLLCVEVLGGDVETVDGIPCNYEAVDGVLLTDDDWLENDEARVVSKDGVDYLVFCENDCVTIVGCENPSKVDLAIPAVIGGRVVTRIGEQAFQYCRNIISVTIPSSVMSIGDWAFCGCSGLASVTIPSGVQTIGFGAFSSCGLTNLTIHSGKTRIGEQAFRDCSSLASVTLPETVMVGNMAFHGCVGLADSNGLVVVNNVLYDGFGSNVDIPSGVTRISGYAFDWRNIKGSLKIPPSVTSIGECAFLTPSREGIGSVYVDDLKQFATIEFEDKYSNPVTFAKEFYVAGELVMGTCTVTYVADDGGWFEDADSEYGFANQKTVEVEIGKGVLWPPECRYGGEFGRKIVGWEGENCVISDVVVHPIYGTPSLEEVLYNSGLEVACAYDHFYYDTTEGTIHTEGAIGFSDEWRFFELFNGGNLYITAVADDGAGHVICKKSRKVTMSYEDNPYYKVNIDGTWNFSFKDAQRKVRGISVYIESPSYPGPGDSSTYICNQYEPAYQVTFDLGNKCSQVSNVDLVQYVEEGGHAVVPSVRTEKGWKWLGWSADVTQEISETTKFDAICEPIVYSVLYANTRGIDNPNPATYTVTNEIVFAALPDTDEYWFKGWEPAKIEVGTTGDLVVTAKWDRILPAVEGDEGATVTGDAETGFVVKPSEGKTAVEVTIPQGVDAAKVTVEVSPKVASVKPNGANVKIVNAGADITEFLNVPAADGNGVVDLTKATVKEAIVKEAMDLAKGAKIELNAANPSLTTPNTRVGLFYQLREGATLEGMSNGDSTIGDGNPWKPEIKVKGGNSAFYSIGVGKGE